MQRYLHDFYIALDAIFANKMKSILTTLGIIFGVAAVISMLAIGNGAKQELLEQMKLVGVNNIVITPVIEEDENSETSSTEETRPGEKPKQKYSRGLCLSDVKAIENVLPVVEKISPEINIDAYVIKNGKQRTANVIGITPVYFELFSLGLQSGKMFNTYQMEHGLDVCIIGEDIRKKFFSNEDPLGKSIKCGNIWLRVVGILKKRKTSVSNVSLKLSNSNECIYVPIKTMLLKFKNRSLITAKAFDNRRRNNNNNKEVNYNQLDKIIVQVKNTEQLEPASEIIGRMLLRRHSDVEDFEISVPELQLKQQQKTKDIFNIVLGAIAGISLIVGGIGIMNIMLASVMERIKEIGIRLAIGATKKDIIVQFLSESTLISISGGLLGIVLGAVISKMITRFADIDTIISFSSIIIAFSVSAIVGVIFGYMPAKRAAEKDPVESLKYE